MVLEGVLRVMIYVCFLMSILSNLGFSFGRWVLLYNGYLFVLRCSMNLHVVRFVSSSLIVVRCVWLRWFRSDSYLGRFLYSVRSLSCEWPAVVEPCFYL